MDPVEAGGDAVVAVAADAAAAGVDGVTAGDDVAVAENSMDDAMDADTDAEADAEDEETAADATAVLPLALAFACVDAAAVVVEENERGVVTVKVTA